MDETVLWLFIWARKGETTLRVGERGWPITSVTSFKVPFTWG